MLVRTHTDLISPDPAGLRVLVPTMGALHRGHEALIGRARELARTLSVQPGGGGGRALVVVSIFVNPSQFNEPSDFERYPRDLDRDVEVALAAGADVVYAPSACEVYPEDREIPVGELPPVATEPGLEDRFRPGHFAGVVRVVRRFFELTQPAAACFGEKDWQQLAVIRALIRDEGLGVHIEPVATVREGDQGLALSSRNRLLSDADRLKAHSISEALRAARTSRTPDQAERAMAEVLEAGSVRTQYAVVRDAATLMPIAGDVAPMPGSARALIAGQVGGSDDEDAVRLIDNAPACLGNEA